MVNITRIENATRVLGQQQGFLGLPVRDESICMSEGGLAENVMLSSWELMPDEFDKLVVDGILVVSFMTLVAPTAFLRIGRERPETDEGQPVQVPGRPPQFIREKSEGSQRQNYYIRIYTQIPASGLKKLHDGEPLILGVLGTAHPPVMLYVE